MSGIKCSRLLLVVFFVFVCGFQVMESAVYALSKEQKKFAADVKARAKKIIKLSTSVGKNSFKSKDLTKLSVDSLVYHGTTSRMIDNHIKTLNERLKAKNPILRLFSSERGDVKKLEQIKKLKETHLQQKAIDEAKYKEKYAHYRKLEDRTDDRALIKKNALILDLAAHEKAYGLAKEKYAKLGHAGARKMQDKVERKLEKMPLDAVRGHYSAKGAGISASKVPAAKPRTY